MSAKTDLVESYLPGPLVAEYDTDARALASLTAEELGERFPDSTYAGDRFITPPVSRWAASAFEIPAVDHRVPAWVRWCRRYAKAWVLVAVALLTLHAVLVLAGSPSNYPIAIAIAGILPVLPLYIFTDFKTAHRLGKIQDLLVDRLREHSELWFSGGITLREMLERRMSSLETAASAIGEFAGTETKDA